jgi:hypothetical protein
VGVAMAATGVALGVTGLDKTNDAAAAYAAAQTNAGAQLALDQHEAGRRQLTAGWVLTGIGGAALVAGVVMAIVAPSSEPASRANARVSVGLFPTGNGVAWYGQF